MRHLASAGDGPAVGMVASVADRAFNHATAITWLDQFQTERAAMFLFAQEAHRRGVLRIAILGGWARAAGLRANAFFNDLPGGQGGLSSCTDALGRRTAS
jgi:hypothetical protein